MVLPGLPKSKVSFRFGAGGIASHEVVKVTGNCTELGQWDPCKGLAMERNEEVPGCWSSQGVDLPIGKVVQYKYVICATPDAQGETRWEPLEGNRKVVPTGFYHDVEDDDGALRHLLDRRQMSVASVRKDSSDIVSSSLPPSKDSGSNMRPRAKSKDDSGNLQAAPKSALKRLDQEDCSSPKRRSGASFASGASLFAAPADEEDPKVTSEDPVVIVFRSLPFSVQRSESSGDWQVIEKVSEKHYFSVVSLMQEIMKEDDTTNSLNLRFVGDPGVSVSDPDERRRIAEVLAPYNCIPVFIDPDQKKIYSDFCNEFLWQTMHNVKVFDRELATERYSEGWASFQNVNKAFAEAIELNARKGALVWIHNYHLLLVPRYIYQRNPTIGVSFFLHSGFPNSEMLRCLPSREEIILSLLKCKVVTFQIFEYARHFLSSCQYLLGATHSFQTGGVLQIEHDGKSVVVRADHFAIPFSKFESRLDNADMKTKAAEVKKKFGGKFLMASIDGNEPFAGMVQKLRAFDRFLTECTQHQRTVALLQHVLVDRDRNSKNRDLIDELKRVADEINRKFGRPGEPPVVEVAEGPLNVDERLGILQSANVLVDTSINDGWNLQPFMFYCAHAKDQNGMAIVSEFTGCHAFLTKSLKINPWNTRKVIEQMHAAVTMTETERTMRFRADYNYVSSQTLTAWVQQNLGELKRALLAQSNSPVKGLGAGLKWFFMEKGFQHLNFDEICRDYKLATNRVLFLDNEGTLAPKKMGLVRNDEQVIRSGRPLDPQLQESIQALIQDPRNTVVVLSGRGTDFLDKSFVDMDGLGLCAEYGFYWVQPKKLKSPGSYQRWHCLATDPEEDRDWKELAIALMQMYCKRVQGSFVENKGSAITWNYRLVSAPLLAQQMAMELQTFLDPDQPEGLLRGYPVATARGKGYVEVKRLDIDKGVAVRRVLDEMEVQLGPIDFILCIGDDRSDEDMFELVDAWTKKKLELLAAEQMSPSDDDELDLDPSPSKTFARQKSNSVVESPFARQTSASAVDDNRAAMMKKRTSQTLEDKDMYMDKNRTCSYYTSTVGRKPSKARYYVKDTEEVSELLKKFATLTTKARLSRFSSMPTLAGMGED